MKNTLLSLCSLIFVHTLFCMETSSPPVSPTATTQFAFPMSPRRLAPSALQKKTTTITSPSSINPDHNDGLFLGSLNQRLLTDAARPASPRLFTHAVRPTSPRAFTHQGEVPPPLRAQLLNPCKDIENITKLRALTDDLLPSRCLVLRASKKVLKKELGKNVTAYLMLLRSHIEKEIHILKLHKALEDIARQHYKEIEQEKGLQLEGKKLPPTP